MSNNGAERLERNRRTACRPLAVPGWRARSIRQARAHRRRSDPPQRGHSPSNNRRLELFKEAKENTMLPSISNCFGTTRQDLSLHWFAWTAVADGARQVPPRKALCRRQEGRRSRAGGPIAATATSKSSPASLRHPLQRCSNEVAAENSTPTPPKSHASCPLVARHPAREFPWRRREWT